MPRIMPGVIRLPLLLVLLLAAVALVACGGDDDDDDSAPAPAATSAPAVAATTDMGAAAGATINVTPGEWSVAVDQNSAPAGDVVFSIANGGAVPHEFVVVRRDLAADALPTDGGMVDEAQIEVVGRVEEIPGAGTAELSLSLEAGGYVLICNVPAHYDLDMRTAFTVE